MNNHEFPMRCRKDYVLIRVVFLGETDTGIAMPDSAIQGKEFHVVSVGPDVKDLREGDRVLMLGDPRTTFFFMLPSHKDMLAVREDHCVLVDRPFKEE